MWSGEEHCGDDFGPSNRFDYELVDSDTQDQDDYTDITENYSKTNGLCEEEEYTYEVISNKNIIDTMKKEVIEINNVINPPLPRSNAIALLNYMKWDKDRL